jgi:hypothetical protein
VLLNFWPATTVIAAVGVAIAYAVWESGIFPFARIPMPFITPVR